MPESKVIAFKIAGNWGGFPMQTRYLVKKFIISLCCAHHAVQYILHWFWTCGLVSHFD